MKRKNIIYLILGLVLASGIIYRIAKNRQLGSEGKGGKMGAMKGGKSGMMPPSKVNGVVIAAQNFESSLSLSGSIEGSEMVQIRSEISGLVKGIYFQEGSTVTQGQLLVKLNDTELQAQLKQALSKEKLAAETESRAKQLLKKEAISQEEYDVALAELNSLKAQTELIRAQLSKTTIKAPFSGRIGLRSISAGEYLTPSATIARLVNSNQVKIAFSVPEKYAGKIDKNSQIEFTIAGSAETFQAKIYAIEPGIETTTRTLQLKALANNPKGVLLPGSFAKINLPLQRIKDALLIPTQSIIPVLRGKQVYISENGLAKPVMIETGPRTDKDVLVLSGLKVGDTLLTTGIMSLKPETPVKVTVKN